MVFSERFHGPFEIFARAKSRNYFVKLMVALGIPGKSALSALADRYSNRELPVLDWRDHSYNPSHFMKLEDVDTRA